MDHTQILSYLIKKPDQVSKFGFLEDILMGEDYVLFFYLQNNYVEGIGFNRYLLSLSLKTNASTWVNEKSKLFKKGKMTLDYIKSATETAIITATDHAIALTNMVLDRYDELVEIGKEKDEDLSQSMQLVQKYAENEMGRKLLDEVVELVKGGKWHEGRTYQVNEIIPYLNSRLEVINQITDITDNNETYVDQIVNTFADSALSYSQCFEWNLGQNINLPNINRGYLVSLIGQEKAGKTKFVLGEMVYNTIRMGQNALVYSGEMKQEEIINNLLIKHIYVTMEYKIDSVKSLAFTKVHFFLQKHGITMQQYKDEIERRVKLRKGVLLGDTAPLVPTDLMKKMQRMKGDIKIYEDVDQTQREVILSGFTDLLLNERYGTVFLYTQEHGVFNIDTMISTTRGLVKKHDVAIWVLDHAGFVDSNKGMDKFEGITKAYQYAKAIASTDDHPVASVVVNHLESSSNTAIKQGKSGAESGLRAYGTSEGNKSADVEIALYATPGDKIDGLIKLDVIVSRHEAGPEAPLTLVADKGVNDFIGIGSTKNKYPDGKDDLYEYE